MITAREALKKAFVSLLETRPLRDITVQSVVQACGVNRNSFYYHFKDIHALLEEVLGDAVDRIIAAQGPVVSLEDCLRAVAEEAAGHRMLLLHVSQSAHRELFENQLMRICRRMVLDYAAAAFRDVQITEEDREILVRFFQCECFGQVMVWLQEGARYDLQDQFRRLCRLAEGMTELLLDHAAAEARR